MYLALLLHQLPHIPFEEMSINHKLDHCHVKIKGTSLNNAFCIQIHFYLTSQNVFDLCDDLMLKDICLAADWLRT